MVVDDGFQSCESIIPVIPSNNVSRSIHQGEVRPTPRQKLLHFFQLTAADEPLQKKMFFGPATGLPRNCESFSPFSLERVSNDCGSDTNVQGGRPMLGFRQEGMQTSEADQGIHFANRSEDELPLSSHQDTCALSLATRNDKEPSPERDLCALSLATYHVSLPSLEVGADQGIDAVNWSENELGPWDRDLCALSLATGPALLSLLEVGATRHRTVINPQPVRAILNNNIRFAAMASEWQAQGSAQPQATQPLEQPVHPPPLPPPQCPAHPQTQVPAQLGTQPPMGQPLGQSIQQPAHPRAQIPTQPREQSVQPSVQPLAAQHGAQSSRHSPAQPRVQPLEQSLQPQVQRGAQPRRHSPEEHLQPPADPRPQPRAQPQTHSPGEPTALPLVQSQAQPGHWPLAQPQAQPIEPPGQSRVLAPTQPQGQGRGQPSAAQPRAPAQPQRQAHPGVRPPMRHGPQSQTSRFKGVTLYKRTGRWEAHIWGHNKKQIYLGASSTENQAARAYDRAAIHFRGVNAQINFPLADYQSELPRLDPAAITPTQLVTMLRKQSSGAGTLHPEYPQP